MNRSECNKSMMMDFNKGVDVAKAALCVSGMLEQEPDTDINKEL